MPGDTRAIPIRRSLLISAHLASRTEAQLPCAKGQSGPVSRDWPSATSSAAAQPAARLGGGKEAPSIRSSRSKRQPWKERARTLNSMFFVLMYPAQAKGPPRPCTRTGASLPTPDGYGERDSHAMGALPHCAIVRDSQSVNCSGIARDNGRDKTPRRRGQEGGRRSGSLGPC
jgi:hypothetical protein